MASTITRLPAVLALMLAFQASVLHGQEVAEAASDLSIPSANDGLPGDGPIRRFDWFQRLWNQRRAQFDRNKQQDHGAVVFFGDSITQQWGENLGGAFPGLKVANRGISGDTTRGMLIRLENDVLAVDPAAVVLLMGTNDIDEGATTETIASNVKLIIEALEEHDSDLPIVLCQVMPSSPDERRPPSKIRPLNAAYAELNKQHPRVTMIETWTLFANGEGNAKSEEFPDLLHPNQAGYAKWSAALRPIFATLGLIETEPDEFALEPGYESLFNGHDLTGWGERRRGGDFVSFDDAKASPDGRYVATNGRIVVTTPPEGRRIQTMWTERQFPQDFTLKLEFRATPNADSGVFIRGPQLQCRDYPLAGPYEDLKNYKPQDWNEMVVVVKGGSAHCTCNGEVLEEAMRLPATGPIGLEGDRGQMEYRRIRVKEGE